jgi:hypothetical protein
MAMRLGTEDKKKRIIAMVAVSLALTLIAHMVWQLATGSGSETPPPEAPTVSSHAELVSGPAARQVTSAAALDPTLHPERMALAENTRYTGTSRNIFSKDSLPPVQANAAIEKPLANVRSGAAGAAAGPPPPPPIDLKFYGFATRQGARKLIFLMHGDDLFIAGEGDIVDGRYKVVSISDTGVVIDDLSYNNQQTIPLETN